MPIRILRMSSRVVRAGAVGLFAAFLSAAIGYAEDAANDPETCAEVWQEIGLPETEDGLHDPTPVCHEAYILGHNRKTRTPDWVVEHLTKKLVRKVHSRPSKKFRTEPSLPDDVAGAATADYEGGLELGIDIGHQAPSEDYSSSKRLMEDTFFFSNAVPQDANFNRGVWRSLETRVRKLAANRGEIYVITGPVNLAKPVKIDGDVEGCGTSFKLKKPDRKAVGNVRVPAALYKIIYDPKQGFFDAARLNAFLLPNVNHSKLKDTSSTPAYLQRYRVRLETIETLTGLNFLPELDERTKAQLATDCPTSMLH